jgi:precorrin-2 C(20)-methyltransferase
MHDTLGRLIGVSLGPGDPMMITRAAWAELQRRDTRWVYPVRSGNSESHAFGIVRRAGIEPVADHQPLVFPMTYDAEKLGKAWLKTAQTVLPWLQAGQDVLFLVEGDASTYATFGHLARTVKSLDERISTPVIAGINAFTAAGAMVGQPLAEQDDTMAVVPAAYGVSMLPRLLHDFDTLVLMKVKPVLDELIDWLMKHGLLGEAHFVEKVGAEGERSVSGDALLDLRGQKVSYLSLVIVRHPHRIRGERIRGCLKKPKVEGQGASSTSTVAPAVADPDASRTGGTGAGQGADGAGSALPLSGANAAELVATTPGVRSVPPVQPTQEARVCLLAITKGGVAHAVRLARMLPHATVCTLPKFAADLETLPNEKFICQKTLREEMGGIFGRFDQLVCFVSLGAVVRLVAPHLKDKETDPGVIVVDDAARYVVPMLSGHVGGANVWAERVARLLDATAVLTTASDAGGTLAVDILGRELGWEVEAPKINLTRVAAAVVNHERIAIVQETGSRNWWTRKTPLPASIEILDDLADVKPGYHQALLWITHRTVDASFWTQWPERLIVYRPPQGQDEDARPGDGTTKEATA